MSEDDEVCHCTHKSAEHGLEPNYPGATACSVDGCYCISFEKQEELAGE